MNLRLGLISLCLSASMPALLHAAFSDGMLDTTFDGDGIVQTDLGSVQFESAYAVAAQPDGKTVVVGYSQVGYHFQVALARYTKTGALDASFGTGGKVLTDATPDHDEGLEVAIQPDGKIVVVGRSYAYATSLDFLVLRYTAEGVLDTTFGTGGIVTIPITGEHDSAAAVALQSDGKIVIAGYASIGGSQDMAVVRLTNTGILDTTFSGDGIATVDFGSGGGFANAVAVQGDGQIVLAGGFYQGASYDFALARLTTTGALDNSFGTAGKITTSLTSSDDYAGAVAILTTGEIIAAGSSASAGNFVLARYTTSGALDGNFGTGGIVSTTMGSNAYCNALAMQSDGKIIAAGYATVITSNFATVRYTSTGAIDTSFGTGGKAMTAFGNGAASGYGVALHADGRIALAGSSYSYAGGTDFGVVMLGVPLPDIAVAQGSALTDGVGTVSLGGAAAGSSGAGVTFTITNPGNAELNNLAVSISGADEEDFTVSSLSGTIIPPGGGSVTFQVTFSPDTGGTKTATLQIANNLSGAKNPFDITLTATALTAAQDTDNDGLNDLAEFQMAALGFDWQVTQTTLVETYHTTANGAGLFKPSQVQAIKLPTPQIQYNPLTGDHTLSFGIEKSAALEPAAFSPFPITAPQVSLQDGKLEVRFTGQDSAAFFRITGQ